MDEKSVESTTKMSFEGFMLFLRVPLDDKAKLKEYLRNLKQEKLSAVSIKEKRKRNLKKKKLPLIIYNK